MVATYKILSWKEIPTQIRAEDELDTVNVMLDERFMRMVDAQAMKEGSTETDAFLSAWHWSEEREREGSAEEVAAAVKAEIEGKK